MAGAARIVSVQTAWVEADGVDVPRGVLHEVPNVPEFLRLDVGEETVADVRLARGVGGAVADALAPGGQTAGLAAVSRASQGLVVPVDVMFVGRLGHALAV